MRRVIIGAAVLLAPSLAWADPLDDILRGVSLDSETFLTRYQNDSPLLSERVSLTALVPLSDRFSFNLAGYAAAAVPDDPRQGGPSLLAGDSSDARHGEVTALNLTWMGPGISVIAGKADLTMGVAEVHSSVDRFEPSDYSDPLHSRRLGRIQLRGDVQIGDDTATLVLLPVEELSRTPSASANWVGLGDLISLMRWNDIPTDVRDPALTNGALIRYAGVRDGYDFFVGAHYGPGAYATTRLDGGALVKSWPDALSGFGGAVATVGNWRIYGEALFQHTFNGWDQDFLRYTVGASVRLFDIAATLGVQEIIPTLEFADDIVTADTLSSSLYMSSATERPFNSTLIGKLRVKVSDDLGVTWISGFNVVDHGYGALIGLDYQLSDGLLLNAQAGMTGGPSTSQIGEFGNSRVFTIGFLYKV